MRFSAFLTVLVLALCAAASAQATPATATRIAPFALREAYNEIAEAELHGASPYLDAAKAHYRSALERAQRNDRGAPGEALAAAALARAAIADRPLPAPRDIPSPPPFQRNGVRPPQLQPRPGGPPRMERGRRFDAARLSQDAKSAGTSEARDLAQKAVDADLARTRAAYGGNLADARRQGRIATALAQAVHALALAAHPPEARRFRGGFPSDRRPAPGTKID